MPRFISHGRRLLALLLFGLILHLSIYSNAFHLPSSLRVSNHNLQHSCQQPRHHQHHQSTALLTAVPTSIVDTQTTNNKQIIRNHYNLTILIPAYNEIDRIGETLFTYINYIKHQPVYQHVTTTSSLMQSVISTGQCSILVIDDGSTDGMCRYIQEKTWLDDQSSNDDLNEGDNCWKVEEQVSCISLPTNEGKGAAISRGMMDLQCSAEERSEHGNTRTRSIVLVADADGSGDIACLDDMIHSLECLLESSSTTINATTAAAANENDLAIIVGKRQYPQSKKSPLRSLLSWGFRTCVSTLFIGTSTASSNNANTLGVTDTQCGLKLMTTQTGKVLYRQLNLKRWSHDVEVLYRASCLCRNVSVGECNVNWVDKDGSKLVSSGKDAAVMSAVMLGEIGKMRLLYALGRWNMSPRESSE